MHQRQAKPAIQQFRDQMVGGPKAGGTVIHAAQIGLHPGDEFLQVLCRHGVVHRNRIHHTARPEYRDQIAFNIIGHARINRRVDRAIADGAGAKRIAIWRAFRRCIHADIAIGAGAIFYHPRMWRAAADAIRQDAPDQVRGAPRRERQDDAHWAFRDPALRKRKPGQAKGEKGQGNPAQHGTSLVLGLMGLWGEYHA